LASDQHLALRDLPESILPKLEEALEALESWLVRNEPAEFRAELLQLFFRMHGFLRTAQRYDERYRTIPGQDDRGHLRLFCVDPSALVREAMDRGQAVILFSATLSPLEYYRTVLGGDATDPTLQLGSPFPKEHLAVLVQTRLRTYLRQRAQTVREVASAVGAFVQGRAGNYLVYLPSYHYLKDVNAAFAALHPEVRVRAQAAGMSELERTGFLDEFAVGATGTTVGFAVLGGVFGEGIDLVGERLIGAVVVGVGMPPLSTERDLIRDYFEERLNAGFDYAYLFPGMNRVLQAVGRVIRSEQDRGAVLLIDTRFAEWRYRRLFREVWTPVRVASDEQIRAALAAFWSPS
jgi:DNA excision repair protein ERCC-2